MKREKIGRGRITVGDACKDAIVFFIPPSNQLCRTQSTVSRIIDVWIRWTGTMEWNGGMDWTGLEWWIGMEWNEYLRVVHRPSLDLPAFIIILYYYTGTIHYLSER